MQSLERKQWREKPTKQGQKLGKKIEFERENGGAIEVEDDDYDDDDAIRVCR